MKLFTKFFGVLLASVLVAVLLPTQALGQYYYGSTAVGEGGSCTVASPCTVNGALSAAANHDGGGGIAAIKVDYDGASHTLSGVVASGGASAVTLAAYDTDDGLPTQGYLVSGSFHLNGLNLGNFGLRPHADATVTAGGTISLSGTAPGPRDQEAALGIFGWYYCQFAEAGVTPAQTGCEPGNTGDYPSYYTNRKSIGLLAGPITLTGNAIVDGTGAYVTDLNLASGSSLTVRGTVTVTNSLMADGPIRLATSTARFVFGPGHYDGSDATYDPTTSFVLNSTISGPGTVEFDQQPEYLFSHKAKTSGTGYDTEYLGFGLEKANALKVTGTGSINAKVTTVNQAGTNLVGIDFGVAGSANEMNGGVLFTNGDITGDLNITGAAQVVASGSTINGDVNVTHTTTITGGQTLRPLGLPEFPSTKVGTRAIECWGTKTAVATRAAGRSLTSGLHTSGNVTITGHLVIDDAKQGLDKCQGGLHILSGTLTAMQLVRAKNAAQINFAGPRGTTPRSATLAIKGPRLDLRGIKWGESQFMGDGAETSNGDVCDRSTVVHPSTSGSIIEFSGAGQQGIYADAGSTLELNKIGIAVDKATDWESLEFRGTDVKVKAMAVFVDQGQFITGGNLGVAKGFLHVDQSLDGEGSITAGAGLPNPFLEDMEPERLIVTGNRSSIDHRGMGNFNPKYITLSLATASSVWTVSQDFGPEYNDPDTPTTPTQQLTLYLNKGTLRITDNGSVDARWAYIGQASVKPVGQGTWDVPEYVYFQNVKNDADISDIIPPHATVTAAVSRNTPRPNVTLLNCKVDQTLKLGSAENAVGYNTVGSLAIRGSNKVDIAGQVLTPIGSTVSSTSGTIIFGSSGTGSTAEVGELIDSSGDSAVPADELEDLKEALADFQETDSDATRKALADAQSAYDNAKAAAAASARVGYVYVPYGGNLLALGNPSLPDVTPSLPNVFVSAFGRLDFWFGDFLIDNFYIADAYVSPTTGNRLYAGASLAYYGADVTVGDMYMGDSSYVSTSSSSSLTVGGDFEMGDGYAWMDLNGADLLTVGSFSAGENNTVLLDGGRHTALGNVSVGATPGGSELYDPRGYDMEFLLTPALTATGTGGCDSGADGLHFMGDSLFLASDIDDGTVTFSGSNDATVDLQQVCSVTMQMASKTNSITGDLDLSKDGILTLNVGMVDGDVMEHNMVEERYTDDDANGNTVTTSRATASRLSFVKGMHTQPMSDGTQTGGVVWSGDEFSLGAQMENGDTYFLPVTIQNHGNAGQTTLVSAMYAAHIMADSVAWPDDNLVVDASGGGTLTLDAVGDMFWKVEFDATPPHDPNINLAADGLHNVFDIDGLRVVQWDCDGTNPRLAGVYDVSDGPTDDDSNSGNDFINGIPHLSQEGVNVDSCGIFGIAANALENPIHLDPILGGTARVQFIHNVAGNIVVDVYVDDNKVVDDFAFQTARPFGIVAAGTHKVDIVPANAPDNSAPLLSESIRFRRDTDYHVIAHGLAATGDVEVVVREGVRTTANVSNTVDFYMVHGAAELGMVDLRTLDPVDNTMVIELLANNFDFKDVGTYLSLDAGGHNIEVTTPNNDTQIDVFRLELQQYTDLAFVLNLSGAGKSSGEGVTMMGVPSDGVAFFPQVITSAEGTELPTEFALLGNYPNPFNPSTRIAFDLPETAQVSVTVFDLLGRSVLTLPAQELEAGQARSIELNASSLSSGNYFYRVIATGASGRHIESGRMLLIK